MARSAAHLLVSGIVQGVGFRYWVERTAGELGLAGWVRNLEDGRVEIYVEGETDRLRALEERTRRGPRSARVSDVAYAIAKPQNLVSFEVRRDADRPESFERPTS
jgi:acylphosphatase